MQNLKLIGRQHLKGDIFGGITAGVVALPLALAFGVTSGMGAIAGLYGAIAVGFFAALFGGTATQVSGPTGPMTVISAGIVAKMIEEYGSLEASFSYIILAFMMAGAMQIGLGLLKLGKYVKYIPYPVVSGFMSGIGLIIINLQIPDLLGVSQKMNWVNIADILAQTNPTALIVALSTIAIVYVFPLVTRFVPSTLVALILVSLAVYLLKLDIPKIGDIPSGLPSIHLPYVSDLGVLYTLTSTAFTLAALGMIDSLLTSVVADNITKTNHHSNQELVGQGIGNMAAALIGGLPGAGATMRTVVNIKSGGKTPLSGMIHSIFLVIVLLGASAFAAQIPMAVLAGILITVGISILDYEGLRYVRFVPRQDIIVMLVVLVMTVAVDLLQAVGVGMVLTALFFMKKTSDMVSQKAKLTQLADCEEATWLAEVGLSENTLKGVIIKYLEGPLFFGVVLEFQRLLNNLRPETRVLVLRMEHVPYIDQSGLHAFKNVIEMLKEKNVKVMIAGIRRSPMKILSATRIVPDFISEEALFPDLKSCIDRLQQPNLRNNISIEEILQADPT